MTNLVEPELPFGDIAPGETDTSIYFYSIRLDEAFPGGNDLLVYLSIASEGDTFWSDSFSVHINPLGIAENESAQPNAYALHPNYPNPFNPVTTLRFDLPAATDVRMTIFDLLGREVARLVDRRLEAGYQRVDWNGRDARGREVPTGLYIARMVTLEYTKSIKMVLLK